MKTKTSFTCSNCNYITVKWIGCCPECKEWDSLTENRVTAHTTFANKSHPVHSARLMRLDAIDTTEQPRVLAGIGEWDRVVGGGLVPGSLIVITGDPGIGKSTLLLQVAHEIAKTKRVFYFSTEESLQQLKGRATRLKTATNDLLFSDTAELNSIVAAAQQQKPDLLIIDSIQNCYISDTQTLPGSVGQLREAAFQLMRLSKENNITVIITGHITKEGIIAGPKTLEHMVDAVFYLQGEDRWQTRMLRAVKNRLAPLMN